MTTLALKGKLARYGLEMQQYDFGIRYRTGASNANADGLSRLVALTQHPQGPPCQVFNLHTGRAQDTPAQQTVTTP